MPCSAIKHKITAKPYTDAVDHPTLYTLEVILLWIPTCTGTRVATLTNAHGFSPDGNSKGTARNQYPRGGRLAAARLSSLALRTDRRGRFGRFLMSLLVLLYFLG